MWRRAASRARDLASAASFGSVRSRLGSPPPLPPAALLLATPSSALPARAFPRSRLPRSAAAFVRASLAAAARRPPASRPHAPRSFATSHPSPSPAGPASTAASGSPASGAHVSVGDLRKIFAFNMVPFVAFGFVDNTVLIYAGDAIDRSVGVAFGLSSLAAAAMGQIFSDTSGVLFGSTIEDAALRLGLTMPQLTETQQLARATRFASTAGKVFGVVLGCSLGLVNLLFIDTLAAEKAKEEKEYTAIFRAIMHKGHEVAECAAAALWIVDRENRELWTRAAHGNKMSDLTVRRPFGVGIVGSVAETGELSNVVDAYSHPRFDRTVDRDGITGFKSDTLLTCPVKNDEGEIVAVVQLVNKHEKKRTKAKKEKSGTTTASRDEGAPGAGRGEGEKRRRSFFGRGGFFSGAGAEFRREKASMRFDESDEKLIRLIAHHVSVSLAAMEHKLPIAE